MKNAVERLEGLFSAFPPKWYEIEAILNESSLSNEDMSELAYSVADNCFCEYAFTLHDDCDNDESKIDPSHLHSTYLLQSLEILLRHGLDPNAETKYMSNVLDSVRYADYKSVAASAMRLLLEHGADPNLRLSCELESIFEDLDFLVSYEEYLGEPTYRRNFQCWLVLTAFGACYRNGTPPVKVLNNHSVTIFKDFEHFDFKIEMLPQDPQGPHYYDNFIIHIFDTRTGEEVATH